MVVTSNAMVLAQRMTIYGQNRFQRVKVALPLVGAIVQGDIRSLTPVITGTLRRGVSFRFYQTGKWTLTLETYGTAYYTKFVELGTYKMSPRRMFQRGSASAYPKIVAYVKTI